MGSLFSSKSTSVQDPTAVEAFNLAKPYYQQGLSGLGSLGTQIQQNPAYSGQRVADLNPFQTQAADTLGGFSGDTAGYSQNFVNSGLGNLGASAGVGGNYQDIYGRASIDPTQMILSQANQYADNPYVGGLIDAANRDTVRGLTEQALPSLVRGMTGTGNINSTAGMKEGQILTRGAQDRMADTANSIRSQFFGQGLNMAQNQYNQGLQNMMSANQGLMSSGSFGAGLLGAGQDYAGNAFNQGLSAGGLFQGQNQAQLDANKAYFDESIQNPLSVYSALVGNAAQTKTQASAGVNTTPSIMSQLAAVGQAGAQAYKAFSDIQMKENIKQEGFLQSGLPLYSFEYKPEFKDVAGRGRFIGVMAQEAQAMFPDAVEIMANGYMAVDYSKIN